ncbi:MAG: hypothetical protein LBU21_09930 [Treponema sp.]|jgi:hypothetical protein|nr:hypothetical protein [Treponema sp.]
MKKLFLVLLSFVLAFPCLWAEDEFVYDTVVTETRFTHGTGFRFGYEDIWARVKYYEWRWASYPTGWGGWSTTSWKETWDEEEGVTFMYPGLAYQAEWKYFMLDISIGGVFHNGNRRNSRDMGGTIRPMVRYAVVDNEKLRYTLLLGPELMLSDSIGASVNLVQELGVKLNERFMPFLGFSIGFDFKHGSYDIEDLVYRPSYSSVDDIDVHPGPVFQFTLGLKTMVLEDVFYYKNKEVYRRRR